ncbi:glycosyltransferase [Nocardioides zhouii]|uniref:glycosyltransferase n=1 Tax=Nocardioides zhouii TaxID=1168729 RepID=UPI0013EAB827|nr:glycosyltransferase [Nocardioides zhouii]
MDALRYARRVKHAVFVAKKKGRVQYIKAKDVAFTAYDRRFPYELDTEKHRDRWGNMPRMYFLHRDPPEGTRTTLTAPRHVYLFWTGSNPLTPARELGVSSIRSHNPDLDVVVVTPDNLPDFVVEGHPLHPAYENLSLNHRSDYLRAYFMHHHGGGYSDVKQTDHCWRAGLERLNSTPELWLIGYPEVSSSSCGGRDARLGPDIRRHFASLIGCATYFVRPGTPFTAEWLRELDRRLDYYADEIAITPGSTWGDNQGYPIAWIELGSDVFHPLQLKYLRHIAQDAALLPHLDDHR